MPTRPVRNIYAVAVSGGAPKQLPLTVNGAKYVEIVECPPNGGAFTGGNYAPQGLNYQLPDDGFVSTYGLLPGQVLSLGSSDAISNPGHGPGLGFRARPDVGNPGVTIPAKIYCQVTSATNTTTYVQVTEWD